MLLENSNLAKNNNFILTIETTDRSRFCWTARICCILLWKLILDSDVGTNDGSRFCFLLPDVDLLESFYIILEINPRFYCRYKRWESDRILSFVPPDGNFRLVSYHIGKCIVSSDEGSPF
jgi:hypothetical protein